MIGVLMHLFLDYLITKGVPLLFPLDTARFSAELLFHYEILIPVCSAAIALWLVRGFIGKKSISRKANNRVLAMLLILMLTYGGLRVEGKEMALSLENHGNIGQGLEGNFEVFPDWGLFQWNVLSKNESSFQVYNYDSLNNRTLYLASYPQLHLEPNAGDPATASDLEKALHLADSQPKVVLFRWRACAVAVNATCNNGSWSLEYYDPVGRAGMVKAPIWMREMVIRSSSIEVKVEGDQAYIIDKDLKYLRQ
jgi:inner membrane protein